MQTKFSRPQFLERLDSRHASAEARSERIEFHERVLSRDEFGGRKETWSKYGEAWAKVIALRGVERLQGEQDSANQTRNFAILPRTDVDENKAIFWDGRLYKIKSIEPLEGRAGLLIEGRFEQATPRVKA